jgi:menaquinone-dependent protoporphyrinogen oxidase
MSILVAYASKHGSTQGIAERIADKLRQCGQDVELSPIGEVGDLTGYDAFVIGGAAYYFHWMKEAAQFVERHQALLRQRPVWLFSDGPLGSSTTDAQGRDVRATAEPKEFAALKTAIDPRATQVFFGALDANQYGFPMRLIVSKMPQGDFRDWSEIDAWAERIAQSLTPALGLGPSLGSDHR